MVDNSQAKRPPGRPQAFKPEEALDRAVEMFWEYGYEGVDVDRIARAVHVTKPALYRAFGDKSTLLLKAVERYAESFGAPMMQAFLVESDIRKAVTGFCEATVNTATGERRSGCMMASAASGQSERVAEIRSYLAQGLSASAEVLTDRFEAEIRAKRLSARLSGRVRGRALIDLMQGMLLRAKVGVPRETLLEDALSYVPLILD
jgi:AcrR family transcriptional regulator